MINTTSNIGKKIKEIRIKKGMTQSDLCGTEITRNLLSVIERGKSLPSLKTLCYIAERLEVPAGYFFSDSEKEDARLVNLIAIDAIKEAYLSEEYFECIKLCQAVPSDNRDDEISLLFALAHFNLSLFYADKLDFKKAYESLTMAQHSAKKCRYIGNDFYKALHFYTLLYKDAVSPNIHKELTELQNASSFVPIDIIIFLSIVSENTNNFVLENLTDKHHKLYIEAVDFMKNEAYNEAFNILAKLAEFGQIPFYMRYFVFDSLEICSEKIDNIKTAYWAAKKKIELMEKSM